MIDNYQRIVLDNLREFYQDLTNDKIECLPGTRVGDVVTVEAFGEICKITPDAITLGNESASSVMGHPHIPLCPPCQS